ncbi:MAG: hypothetical protein ACLFVQ_13965 [Chitinispirillaceae bacterium]
MENDSGYIQYNKRKTEYTMNHANFKTRPHVINTKRIITEFLHVLEKAIATLDSEEVPLKAFASYYAANVRHRPELHTRAGNILPRKQTSVPLK